MANKGFDGWIMMARRKKSRKKTKRKDIFGVPVLHSKKDRQKIGAFGLGFGVAEVATGALAPPPLNTYFMGLGTFTAVSGFLEGTDLTLRKKKKSRKKSRRKR